VDDKLKILIAESLDFSSTAVKQLSNLGDVYLEDLGKDEILSAVLDVDILWIRLRNQITKKIIQAAPKLKYIVTPTTGLNHIDVDFAVQKGISVLSLRNEVEFLRSIRASSEHTLALILSLLRNIPASFSSVRNGFWQRDPYKGSELHEKTVGIVGFGRIGRLVAQYLNAFNCTILTTDPNVKSVQGMPYVTFVELDFLLQNSDIVSLHVDLTEKTTNIFGQEYFSLMKTGSYFINTSRGELVDESALLHVLKNGKLAGAALDVLCNEHILETRENALLSYSKKQENLLITPHIAGCTSESMEKTEMFMVEKLFRTIGLTGE